MQIFQILMKATGKMVNPISLMNHNFDKKGIHYKTFVIFTDEKVISYMVTIRPFIGGYTP